MYEAITEAEISTAPSSGVEIRKSGIFHVQLDERRLICCSRFGIIGWDFANGDQSIELASRVFAK